MGGGYKAPRDGMDALTGPMADSRERLRELERPTGTSIGSLVQQVQQTLANIVAQVNTIATNWMNANSYTKAQIDNQIANPPAGSNVSGNVAASGSISAGGLANFPAGIQSLDARNRVLTSSYAVGYWDGSGRGGTVPSALRYKQDISPADTSELVEAMRTIALVRYRYIQAVEELGDAAPYLLGSIAEYFVAAGLSEWVFFSDDGEPDGINYERLTIPLIAAFQSLDKRLSALEQEPS